MSRLRGLDSIGEADVDFDRNKAGRSFYFVLIALGALLFASIIWAGTANFGWFVVAFASYAAIGFGAGFLLHRWAQDRSRHQVRAGGPLTEQSNKQLATVANPSLDIPTGLHPAHARVLAIGKIDRSLTQAMVADNAARGAVYAVFEKRWLTIAPGTGFATIAPLDQTRLNTLFSVGPTPLPLQRRTGPAVRAVDAITDSFAAEIAQSGYWVWGNPAGDEVRRLARIIWAIAWALLIAGIAVMIALPVGGYTIGAAVLMAGFGVGAGFATRSKSELPGLSPEGAQRAIELRSLQLGLRQASTEQIEALLSNGQLSAYAAWAVILHAPKFIQRVNKLVKKQGEDPAVQHARAVASFAVQPATFALGAVDPLVNVAFLAALPIAIAMWFRRYRIGNRPLLGAPPQGWSTATPPSRQP